MLSLLPLLCLAQLVHTHNNPADSSSSMCHTGTLCSAFVDAGPLGEKVQCAVSHRAVSSAVVVGHCGGKLALHAPLGRPHVPVSLRIGALLWFR